MEDKIDKLLENTYGASESIVNGLKSLAQKVSRQKKHLVIDVLEMESIVNPDKVQPMKDMDRIEVEI